MTCITYQCMRLNIFTYINLRAIILFHCCMKKLNRSRWPCGIRSESAAARLLGLRVRIPQGPYIFLSLECCVLSGRGLCVGPITRPEESCRLWCVWVWSWSLGNKEALPHQGLLRNEKKNKFVIGNRDKVTEELYGDIISLILKK